MTRSDWKQFAEAWSSAFEILSRGKVASPGALRLAFHALEPYPLDQVTGALSRHVRDPNAGRYGLTPADVVRQIDGETPTVDQIIAAARKPRTPLAVLCRIEIGSFNLNNWNMFDLRPSAEGCLAMLPEWKARIEAGRLTNHELERVWHYGADLRSSRLIGGGTGPAMLPEGGDEAGLLEKIQDGAR